MFNNIALLKIESLDCNNVCKEVQKLINRYIQSGSLVDNAYLSIKISNVSSTIEPYRPKLEFVENPES